MLIPKLELEVGACDQVCRGQGNIRQRTSDPSSVSGGLVRPGTSGARKHSHSESPMRAMPMGGKIARRLMVPVGSGYSLPLLGSLRISSFPMVVQGEVAGGGGECS